MIPTIAVYFVDERMCSRLNCHEAAVRRGLTVTAFDTPRRFIKFRVLNERQRGITRAICLFVPWHDRLCKLARASIPHPANITLYRTIVAGIRQEILHLAGREVFSLVWWKAKLNYYLWNIEGLKRRFHYFFIHDGLKIVWTFYELLFMNSVILSKSNLFLLMIQIHSQSLVIFCYTFMIGYMVYKLYHLGKVY